MFFSVIIPIYNVKPYLSECIDSVLKQTFKDYEIILVDDGSNDGSDSICDEYAERYTQISVIHKINGGLSDARNVGTKAARGIYIIYIDSDDYVISENFLDDVYKTAIKKDSDLILYKFQQFIDGTCDLQPCAFSLKAASLRENADDILTCLVQEDAFFASAWTKAIRRSFIEDSHISFEVGLLGEDNEWYLHLLTSCNCSISVIDKSYIAYRQRQGSISKTNKLKNLTDYIYVLEKWSTGIAEANISDRRREALFAAMAKYYANLLIAYERTKDIKKKEYKKRIKSLHGLLKYSKSRRPRLIQRVYSVFGFDGTIFILKLIDR